MKAPTFEGARTIRYTTVPDPRIEAPDDAIVRVRLSAICGSDLHVYQLHQAGACAVKAASELRACRT